MMTILDSFDIASIYQTGFILNQIQMGNKVSVMNIEKTDATIRPEYTFTGTAEEQTGHGIVISGYKPLAENIVIQIGE